jgi:predicted nucleic acid-binding Zn ribbon protein
MAQNKKYCPRCGALVHAGDAYCIRCGYSFKARGKRTDLRSISIVVIILLIFWIVIRIITKRPIIPPTILNFFKNMSINKTG